jgi:hypothetical protein
VGVNWFTAALPSKRNSCIAASRSAASAAIIDYGKRLGCNDISLSCYSQDKTVGLVTV